jgi:hypothetical protein
MRAKPDHEQFEWASRFMELVLRAFRRIHLEYGPFSLGHPWLSTEAPERLNLGPGIELADELTVVAAIVQECLNSPLLMAAPPSTEPGRSGQRYWRIQRECRYDDETLRRADLVVTLYEDVGGRPQALHPPVHVEAKRLHYWTPDFETGTSTLGTKNTAASRVRDDICKLCDSVREGYGYLMIWDVWRGPNAPPGALGEEHLGTDNTPSHFAESLDDPRLRLREARWLPLSWRHQDSSSTFKGPPTVDRFLWIALIEILSLGSALSP